MDTNFFFAFWAVSMLLVITPGADWAYAMAAGIRGKAVIPAVSGLLFAHFIAIVVAAAGAGALIASTPVAMTMLTVVGALYLAWMGVNVLFNPPVPSMADEQDSGSRWSWLLKGFGVSGLNPKLFLLFLALLPQFTDPNGVWSIPAQIVALGLVHLVSCGMVYFVVGFSARKVLGTRPRAAKAVSRFSGASMLVVALILIGEQVFR